MKLNKDYGTNYIMVSLCALLVIGYMLSIFLDYKNHPFEIIIIPTILTAVINGISLAIYLWWKIKYFNLIRMHVKDKYFNYCYFSIFLAFFTNIIALVFLTIFKFPLDKPNNLYLGIGLLIVLCIINLCVVGFHSYANYWISKERLKKILADEKSDNDDSSNQKIESKAEEEPKKVNKTKNNSESKTKKANNTKDGAKEEATAGNFYE